MLKEFQGFYFSSLPVYDFRRVRGKPYTTLEERMIIEWANTGKYTGVEVAKRLGRSKSAFYNKVSELKRKGHKITFARRGEAHVSAKYSDAIVESIRELHPLLNSIAAVSRVFDMPYDTVRSIVQHRTRVN